MQGNVRRTFIRLGSLVYDLHTQGKREILEDGGITELIHQIDGYKKRVKEIELEIEAIQQEEGRKASEPKTKGRNSGKEPPSSFNSTTP